MTMKDPDSGPFLFDTSAERWLARQLDPASAKWFTDYLSQHVVNVSAITVVERIRGYAFLWHQAPPERRMSIELARIEYLSHLGTVWPIDTRIALVAAEIMALIPQPPSITGRPYKRAESSLERMMHWRSNTVIAATALVAGMTLIHNNADDFETIRSAIERSPQRFPRLGPLELIRCNSLA